MSVYREGSIHVRVSCRLTFCSRRARTGEVVDEVYAGSSVEAGLRVALVHIVFTVHPLVAWFALHQKNRSQHKSEKQNIQQHTCRPAAED